MAEDSVETTVAIRTAAGKSFTVSTNMSIKIADVCEHWYFLMLQLRPLLVDQSGIPTELQRLVYAGKILKDDDTLKSIGILVLNVVNFAGFKAGGTVHLVKSSGAQVSIVTSIAILYSCKLISKAPSPSPAASAVRAEV